MLEFTEENYYYCMYCGEYAAELVQEDERDWVIQKTYECLNCGERDYDTVDIED